MIRPARTSAAWMHSSTGASNRDGCGDMVDPPQDDRTKVVQEAIELLAGEERSARTPEDARRLAAARHDAEALLEFDEARKRGAILIVCPDCQARGDLSSGVCPNCGTRVSWPAVYA